MAEGPGEAAPMSYEIKIKGHLSDRWVDWFEGMTFTQESDGTTTLYGPLADQAALHGLLNGIRDLGLTLVSVQRVRSSKHDRGVEGGQGSDQEKPQASW